MRFSVGHVSPHPGWQGPSRALLRMMLLFVSLAALPSVEALTWTETTKAFQVPRGAVGIFRVEFPFRNPDGKRAKILSVVSSCECITARSDRMEYAPGESGTITAEFSPAGKTGRQTTQIAVTMEGSAEPIRLTLVIEGDEPVRVAPRILTWQVGGDRSEKMFDITLGMGVRLLDFSVANPVFKVMSVDGVPAGQCRLKVVPESTVELAQATIRLNLITSGQPEVIVLQAVVR